ncbi:MAG: hypothetical protein IPN61_11785 [Bacteroidetes bacterium]|mgnify:CR=1 FL=1|nr:hypothetical protein [Bacteroidota bacterium]MBK9414074.1 hypothetical protein [Bacteroidota bacterium]
MKYNTSNILFLIILIASAFSCKEKCTDDGSCTADELSWIPYHDGQMLIFENDSSQIDTFFVERTSGFYPKVYDDDSNCPNFESVQAKIRINDNYLQITTSHYYTFPKSQNWPCLYSETTRDFFKDHADSISITVKNKNYSQVRLMMQGQNSYFNNVYYNKTSGIISFQLRDGSVWGLLY